MNEKLYAWIKWGGSFPAGIWAAPKSAWREIPVGATSSGNSVPFCEENFSFLPSLFFPFLSHSFQASPSAQNFGNCSDDLGVFPAFLLSSPSEELDFGSVSLVVFLPGAKIPFWSRFLGRRENFSQAAHGKSGLIAFTPVINELPFSDGSCPCQ